jgi:plasmid stabilization system protein ParE
MSPAELHPAADRELSEVARYYEDQASGLGADFLAEFDRTLGFLRQFPGAGRVLRHGSRRLAFQRFPYHVIYRVEADRVFILAIAHHRRHPGYWHPRA